MLRIIHSYILCGEKAMAVDILEQARQQSQQKSGGGFLSRPIMKTLPADTKGLLTEFSPYDLTKMSDGFGLGGRKDYLGLKDLEQQVKAAFEGIGPAHDVKPGEITAPIDSGHSFVGALTDERGKFSGIAPSL